MRTYGLTLMACSALVSALTSLMIKFMARRGVSTFEIIFYQRLFQWAVNFSFLLLSRVPFDTWWGSSFEHRFWLSLRGLFGFFALACGYWSVAHLSLSDAYTIRSATPLVCGALSCFLLNEQWPVVEIGASITATVGVWLALHGPYTRGGQGYNPSDMVIAVCAPFFAGASFVALRKASRVHKTHPLVIVNFFAMFTVLLSLPMDFILAQSGIPRGDFARGFPGSSFHLTEWGLVMLISLSAFSSQFLLTVGLQRERAAPASVVMLVGIPGSFALQHLFVKGEVLTVESILGGLILTLSIAAVGIRRCREKQEEARRLDSTDKTVGYSSLQKGRDLHPRCNGHKKSNSGVHGNGASGYAYAAVLRKAN